MRNSGIEKVGLHVRIPRFIIIQIEEEKEFGFMPTTVSVLHVLNEKRYGIFVCEKIYSKTFNRMTYHSNFQPSRWGFILLEVSFY
jgi:hypothetical protein